MAGSKKKSTYLIITVPTVTKAQHCIPSLSREGKLFSSYSYMITLSRCSNATQMLKLHQLEN